VEFNGQKATSSDELTNTILGKAPGTKVNLTIVRGKTRQNLTATLGARPLDLPLMGPASPLGVAEPMSPQDMQMAIAAANAVATPRLGLDVVEMMPQLSAFFGAPEGLLVESVRGGTPAGKAGLKAGDVITKVNGIPVTTAREITGIVRQAGGKIVSFTVIRNKKEITLSLELAWNRDPFNRDAVN
jgi:S1-C subfamily serine protease